MVVNRAGFAGVSTIWKAGAMGTKKPSKPYPAELRERAVRLVREQEAEHVSQAGAIRSIAEKVGCHAETLRLWVRQAERDQGLRAGLTTDERERLKALERENRELRQANEILRKASAYFAAAELDRRSKP
jgi:transposase-like protein